MRGFVKIDCAVYIKGKQLYVFELLQVSFVFVIVCTLIQKMRIGIPPDFAVIQLQNPPPFDKGGFYKAEAFGLFSFSFIAVRI